MKKLVLFFSEEHQLAAKSLHWNICKNVQMMISLYGFLWKNGWMNRCGNYSKCTVDLIFTLEWLPRDLKIEDIILVISIVRLFIVQLRLTFPWDFCIVEPRGVWWILRSFEGPGENWSDSLVSLSQHETTKVTTKLPQISLLCMCPYHCILVLKVTLKDEMSKTVPKALVNKDQKKPEFGTDMRSSLSLYHSDSGRCCIGSLI